jgi:hypothetical protein
MLVLAACAPDYDHVLLVAEDEPPGASVSSTSVQVPLGETFVVDATPMSTSGPVSSDFTFDLVSADESVLGIQPVVGSDPGTPRFVVFGASEGATQINVLINGMPETPLRASVTQP